MIDQRRAKDGRLLSTFKIGGQAPENHPRRCEHKASTTRQRCRRWACKKSKYCYKHGGRKQYKGAVQGRLNLPKFYSRYLTKTLNDAIEESLAMSPSEQLNLYEELALLRVFVGRTILLDTAAQKITDSKKRAAASAEAVMLIRDVLKQVESTCRTAAQIQAMSASKLDIFNLAAVVNQIVRCAHEAFKDFPDQAKQFELMIRTQVRIAETTPGTLIKPDDDARSMDASIPAVDEE